MITEIYVDGYRSLIDLKIPMQPGLNILVGPNGGGKTNILSFFEFLSTLISSRVDEAISSQGGIGRVFSRISDNEFNRTISGRVRGHVSFHRRDRSLRHLWYTWDFKISSSVDYDEIEYSEQKLYINMSKAPRVLEESDLIVSRSSDEDHPISIDRIVISRLQPFFQSFNFLNLEGYVSKRSGSYYLGMYSRASDPSNRCIINSFPSQIDVFRAIIRDITSGDTYNFVPEICKQPEDSSRPAVIEKNGAGLASTLYRLERGLRSSSIVNARRQIRISSQAINNFNRISEYVSLASDAIQGIFSKKNPLDNKISIYVTIREKGDGVPFPISHCSDGTVKWIALISTLLTSASGFSIEEPENFLHPNIQKEFLNIVRTESARGSSFTILTTHSESLLNEASPDEIILVWMEEGKTIAKRVSNADDLVREINETGFGLGYYYAAGSVAGD